ncbi:hypothetical protein BH11PLA2_BH11PLA2_01040 [soil metagenome]
MTRIAINFFSEFNSHSVGELLAILHTKIPPTGPCDILLVIGSSGGNNDWSRVAHGSLTTLRREVMLTTVALGTTKSAAATVFCAGQRRISIRTTVFLLHLACADAKQIDHLRANQLHFDLLADDLSHAIAIAHASSKTKEDVLNAMRCSTVLIAEDAKSFGLVHEILTDSNALYDGREVFPIIGIQAPK